ncbi:MAG: helix-turn-helix domain-containing protein [Propionicimonas sp.]|uniref:TetR/AcrR family transcriptional regulator n=1 Tax=Propionicimonas sp. TaxID=1955623 RepID=UPI002B1EDC27|nr:helix-turn-helix domain-containing protein [Propionicimonas sp.]MEA4944793.1 helix-turn-helix domain-containing protein [Propionicimonas sp.]
MTATQDTSTGRRSDAERNDSRILDAAIRLIGRNGGVVSLPEVAKEAGIGRSTVYRRFGSAAELQSRAAAKLICDQIEPTIRQADENSDPLAGYYAIGLALINSVEQLPDASVRLSDLLEEYLSRYEGTLEHIMRNGQRQGRLRPDFATDDIANFTVATLAALALTRLPTRAVDRYLAILFDGLSRTDSQTLPEE